MAFFDDKDDVAAEVDQAEAEVEKIKLGDQEFTQDELSSLVEKGRLAKEIEEKQNTDLSKVFPEFTKKSQQLKEQEAELTELRKLKQDRQAEIEQKSRSGEQLSPEEVRQLAAKHGYITEDNINQYLNTYMSGQKLLNQVRDLQAQGNPYKSDELPKVDPEDHLKWMDENNVSDPEKAYKLRYEAEIDAWKEKQLKANKRPGLHVEDTSSPGNKLPKEVNVNRGNISDFVKSALRGEI